MFARPPVPDGVSRGRECIAGMKAIHRECGVQVRGRTVELGRKADFLLHRKEKKGRSPSFPVHQLLLPTNNGSFHLPQ